VKGYLQRLVRTVTNPTESVHPWTGSIFASAHRGDSNVVPTEELAPAAAIGQASEEISPASEQYSPPLVPMQASPPGTRHNSQTLELRTTQVAAGFTRPERSADQGLSINKRIVFQPLISYVTPEEEPETVLPPRGRRSLSDAEAIIKPGNARRLAVGSPPIPQAKTDGQPVGSHVAGDQQTDEIQIHIGRIEVTAIHPPAPTVPKPRNKEISLDAYLERRDGRAR
jgi:hypothetical protein